LLEAKIELPLHDNQYATYLLQHVTVPEPLQVLVDCSLNVKDVNNDWTNIYHVIGVNGNYENSEVFLSLCEALLELGADVNTRIWYDASSTIPKKSIHQSSTALMYFVGVAEDDGDVELIEWFLKANASPSMCNDKQESALLIAKSRKLHDVVKLLEQAD